jgi:hypothetical protein
MKDFNLNDHSGRLEKWTMDGHRWVAVEPIRKGLDLWGYQDDTAEVVHLGSGTDEEELDKLADRFLFEPEPIHHPFALILDMPADVGRFFKPIALRTAKNSSN